MEQDFPKSTDSFLKASQFQDNEIPLTYIGFEKVANKDVEIKGVMQSWKSRLKFTLRYSYPEFAKDEAGETIIKDDKPLVNKNYDPKYPQGYFITYFFEEGKLTSGSLPLWNCFCLVRPKKGDFLLIGKTGKDKDTKWTVKRASIKDAKAVQAERVISDDDLGPDESVPF